MGARNSKPKAWSGGVNSGGRCLLLGTRVQPLGQRRVSLFHLRPHLVLKRAQKYPRLGVLLKTQDGSKRIPLVTTL